MKTIIILFSALVLLSCKQKERIVYKPYPVEYRSTEYVRVTDSVYVQPLKQESDSITTKDTSSILTNTYCQSKAVVSEGMLTHTLTTLSGASVLAKGRIIETIRLDSIPYAVEVPVPYEVEKALSLSEQIAVRWFWKLLMALVACLGWIFRKPIIVLIRSIIKV